MVLSTGFYRLQNKSIHLVQDPSQPGLVTLATETPASPIKFRRDKAMWLAVDDGQHLSFLSILHI